MTNDLVTHKQVAPAIDVFADSSTFEHAQRVAKVFSQSNLVPQHLRGNVADCLIAYQIARRLNEEPLTVFQNIYVVSGRPGWKTEYVIARANKAGVFKGRIVWESVGSGDSLSVTAKAVLADTGEEVRVTADMRMAKAEGWTKNAKYSSMPEHMLRWRSAAMLVRLYAPEVMLGMPVLEEIETEQQPMKDVTPHEAKTAVQALDDFASQIDHVIDAANGNSHATEETEEDTGAETVHSENRSAEQEEMRRAIAQEQALSDGIPTELRRTAK